MIDFFFAPGFYPRARNDPSLVNLLPAVDGTFFRIQVSISRISKFKKSGQTLTLILTLLLTLVSEVRTRCHPKSTARLPGGIFSYQKSQFGYNLEGL
jgi:hypothetical protein